MNRTKLNIPNISCGHCVKTIQRELGELSGVSTVEGDETTKEINISWDSPATIEEINYPATE